MTTKGVVAILLGTFLTQVAGPALAEGIGARAVNRRDVLGFLAAGALVGTVGRVKADPTSPTVDAAKLARRVEKRGRISDARATKERASTVLGEKRDAFKRARTTYHLTREKQALQRARATRR